jgi:N-acetylmuramoyl-L-alanine amidase
MPGRKWTASDYRYSMNGQEHEDAVFVGAQSAEYWMYDARLGKRWERDPITYPWQSPYATFNNNPIYYADPSGLEGDGDGNKGSGGKSGETITKNPDGSTSSTIKWEGGGSCTVNTPGGDGNASNNKVTLDAGHGDNNSGNKQIDPGAVDGTHYEKDYAAWIEQETYSALKFMGVDAQRTRSWDVNVDPNGPINWRWKLANANGSDVFISFHLNNGNDDKAFAVYQQGKDNEDKSIILGTEILKQISTYFTVDLNSPVKAANKYTRFETLGVLNNFTGGAGVLIEFGGIKSEANRNTILNNRTDIGKKIAEGIYIYMYGSLPKTEE